MKNKIVLIVCLYLCLISCNVFAESKDIEAKYETSYNVDLVKINLDNNSDSINVDNYEFEISTSMEDVEVVIIKAQDEANSYAKEFSDSDENYYMIIYQNGEKIDTSNIDIKITSSSKVLNVYKNDGKLVSKSNEEINLTGNDYFLVVTDVLNFDENNYVITDDDNSVSTIEDIEVPSGSVVEVYNSKDVKIDNSSILGTNYKVVVTTESETVNYIVIVKGDTTGDAKINLNDITRLYHNYKGIEDMDEAYIIAGDVANNGIINLNDVTKLYHYYKNIISSL